MFNNIEKVCIKTFLLTPHSDVTQNWKMLSADVIVCKSTMEQDKIRFIIDEIFKIDQSLTRGRCMLHSKSLRNAPSGRDWLLMRKTYQLAGRPN